MRIALVHSYYSSSQPSGENIVVDLQADALREAGHTVIVVARRTDQYNEDALTLARTAGRVAFGIGDSPAGEVASFAPDVVHVHNLFPNFSDRWLRTWPGPVVATLHNYRSVCAAGSLFRDGAGCSACPTSTSVNAVLHSCYRGSRIGSIPLAISTRGSGASNEVLRRADKLVFLSSRAREKLASVAAVDVASKSTVIPNFSPESRAIAGQRVANDGWVYAGRLTGEKGVMDLVNAWAGSTWLTIAGEGPQAEEVRRASAGKRIRVLGRQSFSEIGNLLTQSRGLVFPSVWEEPAPAMSYLQALAAGVPTVALIGNAVADDVAAHGTGRTFPKIDSLVRSATSAYDWSPYAINARARYEAAFTGAAWVEAMTALYEEVQQ